MATERKTSISLAAGEEATLECDGDVTLALVEGTVEVAGLPMGNDEYRLRLCGGQRRLSVYSLDGGTLSVATSTPIRVAKASSGVPQLFGPVRSVQQSGAAARILIVGGPATGKTYAARAITNLLLREIAGGSSRSHVVFVDGDVTDTGVAGVGVVACCHVAPDAASIDQAFCRSHPIAFYTGVAEVTPASIPNVTVAMAQASEAAGWIARRVEHSTCHLVFEAPSLVGGDAATTMGYYKSLVDATSPTLLLCLGEASSFEGLQHELGRVHRKLAVTVIKPLSTASRGPKKAATLNFDYFFGGPAIPLGCARVAAPLSAITFVRVDHTTMPPTAVHVAQPLPISQIVGAICAVSHAQLLPEVPFANIAGLAVVRGIDVAADEVILVIPTGEMLLPRHYLILPSDDRLVAPEDFETTV